MKKIILISIVFFVVGSLLLYLFFMWFIFGGHTYFIKVPKPENIYAEFPFCLTYEVNGEINTIEDIIVCEFDGFIVEGTSGKYRKWKSYLKSGKERLTLLDLRPLNQFNEFGQEILELYFYYGNAEYYMSDINEYRQRGPQGLDRVSYYYKSKDGSTGGSSYTADVAYEKYKIKLINFKIFEPKNTRQTVK